MRIVAVCGSLRKESFNRKLLQALGARVPDGVTWEIAEIRGIPVYDGDVEAEGFPESVTALQSRIAAADALVLGTPEYNHGVPGPLKNAIDWCSRGPGAKPALEGRPTGVVGATPGPGGTRFAQQAWLQTFRTLGVDPWLAGQLYVSGARGVFGPDGAVTDPDADKRMRTWIEGFTAFVRARR